MQDSRGAPQNCTARYNSYTPPAPAATATPASRSEPERNALMRTMTVEVQAVGVQCTKSVYTAMLPIHLPPLPCLLLHPDFKLISCCG